MRALSRIQADFFLIQISKMGLGGAKRWSFVFEWADIRIERNQTIRIKFKFLKRIRNLMAYYFYLGNNASSPIFFQQNLPVYAPFNYDLPNYSIQHLVQPPAPTNTPNNNANKSTQELTQVVPEEVSRNVNESVRNRRKRERNLDRQLVSAKKNSQSNIINHFFTFFIAKDSSQGVVRRAIKSVKSNTNGEVDLDKIITIFYNIIRLINIKRGRKYINKSILCSYFTEEWLTESIENIDKLDEISVKEIAVILRKCLYNFINEVSITSILTSKRITRHSKNVHLSKRRKILNYTHFRCENE